jgi:hypothetical protein
MSPKAGTGIPRLQEISFLEVSHVAVVEGKGFDDIRLDLINHMWSKRQETDRTGNQAIHRLTENNPRRYVTNAVEALAELMRLGYLVKAQLPSSSQAADVYRNRKFHLTDKGEAWSSMLKEDEAGAYDHLLRSLWAKHPKFVDFFQIISKGGLIVPLASWNDAPEPRSREGYVDYLVQHASVIVAEEPAGWDATAPELRTAIESYIDDRMAFAERRRRPSPYPRHRDFVGACEEAIVKFAFTRAGSSIDYISQEILRRWTKDLGIANFSYHVPGSGALHLWPTAEIVPSNGELTILRRRGEDHAEAILAKLKPAYEEVRRDDRASAWVPIYRLRAAVCWQTKLNDAVFDRVFTEFLAGKRGQDLPFRANVDPAQYGTVPPSEAPLRLPTSRGPRSYYSVTLIPNRQRSAT